MLRVGLTGNIATGKSTVASKFAELGAHVIDADLIAHDLMACGTETYRAVVDQFGKDILCGDGSIDRRILGSIIFNDTEKRLRLDSLTHPAIGSEIFRRIGDLERTSVRGIVLIEAALLVEAGNKEKYHRLIVVTCSPSIQIARLMERGNLTYVGAKARIDSQMSMKEKLKFADYRIDTSGSLAQTYDQVAAVHRDLLLQEMRLACA